MGMGAATEFHERKSWFLSGSQVKKAIRGSEIREMTFKPNDPA